MGNVRSLRCFWLTRGDEVGVRSHQKLGNGAESQRFEAGPRVESRTASDDGRFILRIAH